jgi:hypothetical protein
LCSRADDPNILCPVHTKIVTNTLADATDTMEADVPRNPLLELVDQSGLWVVEEYRQGARNGRTFATHDSQMSALRYAKSKMEADTHPCIVRWDSPESVGGLYWNPLFEYLTVRRDRLVGGWTVVPREGTCAMTVAEDRETAADRGKKFQRLYNFKHLRVYGGRGEEYEERDHRFLRHDITRSGVRFDTDAVTTTGEPERPSASDTAESDDPSGPSDVGQVGPASPGQLGASIPDVTRVEFTDTDGAVHRYSTPWEGGTRAQIITLSRKHADEEPIVDTFAEMFAHWRGADDDPAVATVYESGTDPTSWVAYRVGEHTLADIGTDLPARSRMKVLADVVDAVGAVGAVADDGPVCGLYPENVHLLESDGSRRATVANWGIEWAIRDAVGLDNQGPFTAPEQHDGTLAPTTSVYQLGAIACWLCCEERPPESPAPQSGEIPTPIRQLSPGVRPVIARALAADPDRRQESVEAFYRALVDAA